MLNTRIALLNPKVTEPDVIDNGVELVDLVLVGLSRSIRTL